MKRGTPLTFAGVLLNFACLGQAKLETNRAQAPQDITSKSPVTARTNALPFEPEIAVSAEDAEIKAIKEKARSLVISKSFNELDELAHKFRKSEASFPDGVWKLEQVYEGCKPVAKAPEEEWKAHIAALREWMNAKPKSITARVALADGLVGYGWKARGTGYGNTVTDEGWKLLGERLTEAASVVRQSKSLDEKCPHLWIVELIIAQGQGWEKDQYEKAFREATNSKPGYLRFYSQKATYLLPRWYGEPGDWEKFLTDSADSIGGEEGDILYARVIWRLHSRRYFSNVFRQCKLDWARADRGFQGILRHFPDSLGAKSQRAYFSSLATWASTAQPIFDALEGKVDLSIWRTKENFEKRAQWAYSVPARR